jgi:S1-C subfamily serine protease/TPR repeat protein
MEHFKNIAGNFTVKSLTWMLLLLFLGSTIQLDAQTNVKQKKFEDIKAKAEKGDVGAQYKQDHVAADPPPVAPGTRYEYPFTVTSIPGDRTKAKQLLAEAVRARQAGDFTQSIRAYQDAIAADPTFYDASYGLGLAALNARDYATALEALHRALALQEDSAEARYAFAWTLQKRGYNEDAVHELGKLVTQHPNEARAHLLLGNLYAEKLGQPKLAREQFTLALELDPANAQAANIRAWLQQTNAEQKEFEDTKAKAAKGDALLTWEEINQIANNPTKFEAIKAEAEKGHAGAQDILGRAYDQGNDNDHTESTKWYRRAAVQGNADAQFSLGWWYSLGVGVPKNYIEAYKWCDLAAAHLSDDVAGKTIKISDRESCRIELRVLEERMTPEQISEAQRLAAAFVPRTETAGSNSNSPSPVAADSPVATGTGFFITDNGYLVSNYHVVKDAAKVRLLTSAGLIDAKLVQVDAANDLALLKADGRFAPLPVAASRTVALGGTVATVGFPDIGLQGFAPKLGKGEIASLSGARDDPRYFQISVPVQPGNSGGALVDERGNVIGIVSAKLDASVALAASGALPENVNYAVKSSLLLSFLESVPDVDAKLKALNTADEKFEEVVKSAQDATVLVLVY